MVVEIPCPDEVETFQEDKGEGYGVTKQQALDLAREQAEAKLALLILNYVCERGCRGRIEDHDPIYDTTRPDFEPFPEKDSPGFKCTVARGRLIRIRCRERRPPAGDAFQEDPSSKQAV